MKWRIEIQGEKAKIYRWNKLVHECHKDEASQYVQMAMEDERHPNY